MTDSSGRILKMSYAGICLSLGMVLPFFTAQVPEIGSMLSPMHIPVLLCGFVCGPYWGGAVGFVSPLLRYMLFGMPAMPNCIAIAFELLTYGLISGIMYRLLPKKPVFVYVSLVTAMIIGRAVWGLARFVIAGLGGVQFTMAMFIAGAVTNAIPGIILHIILIPILVIALQKAKLIVNE